jgi:hypothetical protein
MTLLLPAIIDVSIFAGLFFGHIAFLVLNLNAFRLARATPVLRMHSTWLTWSLVATVISLLLFISTTLFYHVGIRLSPELHHYITIVGWVGSAVSIYSSYCLLRLVQSLVTNEATAGTPLLPTEPI